MSTNLGLGAEAISPQALGLIGIFLLLLLLIAFSY